MIFFKKSTFFLLITLVSLQFGCKDKDQPAPVAISDQNSQLLNNGSFIKGTIITKMADDTPITFSFNHSYINPGIVYNDTTFWLFQNNQSLLTTLNQFSGIRIDLDSISDPTPSNTLLYMGATTPVAGNKVFQFTLENSPAGEPITVSNYVYDPSSRSISGNFYITTSNTGNGKQATITGTFHIVGLIDVVYRMGIK